MTLFLCALFPAVLLSIGLSPMYLKFPSCLLVSPLFFLTSLFCFSILQLSPLKHLPPPFSHHFPSCLSSAPTPTLLVLSHLAPSLLRSSAPLPLSTIANFSISAASSSTTPPFSPFYSLHPPPPRSIEYHSVCPIVRIAWVRGWGSQFG